MGRKSRGKKLRRMASETVEPQNTGHAPAGESTQAPPAKSSNYPAILAEFAYPVLDPVNDDADDIKAKFSWAVSIWNKAVADAFPDHEISRQVLDQFPLFMLMVPDEELVDAFIRRKNHDFGNHHFFIVEHTTQTDKLKGNISVSVRVVNIETSGEGNHEGPEDEIKEHKEENT